MSGDRIDIPLLLTVNQQNAIAELAIVCKSIHWSLFGKEEHPTPEQLAAVVDVITRFENVKWDVIYDKMHRTGANT